MLAQIKDIWFAFADWSTNLLARVILAVLYWVVFAPFSIALRWFIQPLKSSANGESFWAEPETNSNTIEKAQQAY